MPISGELAEHIVSLYQQEVIYLNNGVSAARARRIELLTRKDLMDILNDFSVADSTSLVSRYMALKSFERRYSKEELLPLITQAIKGTHPLVQEIMKDRLK